LTRTAASTVGPTIGDAYTAPSSLTASMTRGGPVTPGMADAAPSCAGPPWYIGQPGAVLAGTRADGAALAGADADGAARDRA
jgi:hypothetical protein